MQWKKGQILLWGIGLCLTGCNTLADHNSSTVDLAKLLKNRSYLNSKGTERQFTIVEVLGRIAVLEFSTEFNGIPSFASRKSVEGEPIVGVYFFTNKKATPPAEVAELAANNSGNPLVASASATTGTGNEQMIALTVRKLHDDELKLTTRDLLYSIFKTVPDSVENNKKLVILEDKPAGTKFLFLNGGSAEDQAGWLSFGKLVQEQDRFLIWQYAILDTSPFAVNQPKQYPVDLTKIIREIKMLDYTIFCDPHKPSKQCLQMQQGLMHDLKRASKSTFKPLFPNA